MNSTTINCILFVILTYLLTCIITWGLTTRYIMLLTAFVPGVVAIFLTICNKQKVKSLFKRSSLKNCLLGAMVTIAIILISYGISLIYYSFSPFQGRSMLEELEDLSAGSMLIIELITFVIMMITSISQEIGWRGYLLKNLKNQIPNFYVRAVVVGLIWGIWCIPILYQVSDSTVLKDGLTFSIILTHILCFCAMSILFTWLFEKDNSIWPVIIVQAVSGFVCTIDIILLGSYFPMSTSTVVIGQILGAIVYFVVAMGVIWFDKTRGRSLSNS